MPKKKLQNRIDSLFEDLREAHQDVEVAPDLLERPVSLLPGLIESSEPSKMVVADVPLNGTPFIVPGRKRSKDEEIPGKTTQKRKLSLEKQKPIRSQRRGKNDTASESVVPLRELNSRSNLSSLPQTLLAGRKQGHQQESINSIKVPFAINHQQEALLELIDDSPTRIWTENERLLVEQVSNQLSLALENAYLIQETQSAQAEAEVLYRIAQAATHSLNLEEMLQEMLDRVLHAVGLDAGLIGVYDESHHQLEMIVHQGLPVPVLDTFKRNGLQGSLCDRVFQANSVISLPNLQETIPSGDRAFFEGTNLQFLVNNGILAFHGSPISSEGSLWGALSAFGFSIWSNEATTRTLIQAACRHIGAAIENARLFSREQERRQVADALRQLANTVGSSQDLHEIAKIILNQLPNLIDFHHAEVHLIRNGQCEVFERRTIGEIPKIDNVDARSREASLRLINHLISKALESQATVLSSEEDNNLLGSDEYSNIGRKSWLCAPMVSGQEVVGFLILEPTESKIYTQETTELATAIASQAAIAIKNVVLFEEQKAIAEKLRELDRLKSQFMANLSHELRTPLNSIIGFSRVILKGVDGPTTEEQQQDLTAIHNAGTHLLELINDVLDISKIEAGKMELTYENDINLADLIASAITTASGLINDKSIRVEDNIDPALPVVRVDPTRIRQVLINFLSNAVKFTEEGTITVRAYIRTSPVNVAEGFASEIVVAVTDTGKGISKEDQDKLFQPFSQIDSATRNAGGSGLGLSISRLLIEMHGGRIGVESTQGQGSTFYFTLPVPPELPGKNNYIT
jgi:signal transduction histidine kinase